MTQITQTLTAYITIRPKKKTTTKKTSQTDTAYSNNTKQTNNLRGLYVLTKPQLACAYKGHRLTTTHSEKG